MRPRTKRRALVAVLGSSTGEAMRVLTCGKIVGGYLVSTKPVMRPENPSYGPSGEVPSFTSKPARGSTFGYCKSEIKLTPCGASEGGVRKRFVCYQEQRMRFVCYGASFADGNEARNRRTSSANQWEKGLIVRYKLSAVAK